MKEYSDKELELFKVFKFDYLTKHDIAAPAIYRILVEHCFINNLSGPAVESVRRTAKALSNMSPYRMTKEFDDLIILE